MALSRRANYKSVAKENLKIRLKVVQGKINDILHFIENTGNGELSTPSWLDVIDTLHTLLEDRREVKDALWPSKARKYLKRSPLYDELMAMKVNPGITEEEEVADQCRVCGCTQLNACQGGCYWVEEDLCNVCSEVLTLCPHEVTSEAYDIYRDDVGIVEYTKKCYQCGKEILWSHGHTSVLEG